MLEDMGLGPLLDIPQRFFCFRCTKGAAVIVVVKVKARSRRNEVARREDGSFLVSTTAPPEGGRANAAVISLLAQYMDKPKSSIRIVKGVASRSKIIEIV